MAILRSMKNNAIKLIAALAVCLLGLTAAKAEEKPFTIPEIREWTSAEGEFSFAKKTRIVYPAGEEDLKISAEVLAKQLRKAFGIKAKAKPGVKARKGDVQIVLGEKPAEGYGIEIADKVTITVSTRRAAVWAGATILQIAERREGFTLPCGSIEDWPEYGLRGFMLDTARKFIPFEDMMDYIRNLSYYKMNTLHVHLNDCATVSTFDGWKRTPGSFRLESELFPGLASRDGYYTKKQLLQMQALADSLGVEIIPEIDVPAHCNGITNYRPDFSLEGNGYLLDLFNPDVYNFLDSLFTEYIAGPNPVFKGPKVHIGTDEYGSPSQEVTEKFRGFADRYLNFVADLGKQPCMWGSLTYADGETPVRSKDVLMGIWQNSYADPVKMVEQGYDIISIPGMYVYIVPGVDYFYDYLECDRLYKEWTPAHVGEQVFEENHPHIKGGMFAVWNDHASNGISVGDIQYRTQPAVQVIAAKCWSAEHAERPYDEYEAHRLELSDAPGMMMAGRTRAQDDVCMKVANVKPGMKTGMKRIGYQYTVSFDVEVSPEDGPGTVLFSDGTSTFYLRDPLSGMIGFSRADYLYRFNFAFYPGEKASVTIKGDKESTSLYINGQLVETLSRKAGPFVNESGQMRTKYFMQTLVFPLEKAGEFRSKVTNLEVSNK